MKKGTIYKIENLINGKVYVGQTRQKFERRIKVHLWMLRKGIHDNRYLQNAWNKYGASNFKHSVIEKCSIEELNVSEVFWIAYYKTFHGVYNLESGGSYNKELHESTRRKMSETTKSHGWVGGKHPNARRVICIDTGEVYPSIVEASEDIGCNYDNVHQVCLGNNICVKGKDGKYYQFAYYQKGKKYRLKPINNIKSPKRVVLVNTGEVFESMREASLATGVSQPKISLCCNGKRNFAGRLENGDWMKWLFEEDYDKNKKYSFKRTRVQTIETRNKISKTLRKHTAVQ